MNREMSSPRTPENVGSFRISKGMSPGNSPAYQGEGFYSRGSQSSGGRIASSPNYPSKWESPVTNKTITFNARGSDLDDRSVLTATLYVFLVGLAIALLITLLVGASFLENLVPITGLPAIVALALSIYFMRKKGRMLDELSTQVSDRQAKLLAVDREKMQFPSEPVKARPTNIEGSTRMATPPRIRKTQSSVNESIQRFLSPDKQGSIGSMSASISPARNRPISVASIGKYHESRKESSPSNGPKDNWLSPRVDMSTLGSTGTAQTQRNIEALRRWIALKVVVPFAQRDANCTEQLNRLSSTPNVDQSLAAALLAERANLDRHATVPGYSRSLEYCRSRLRALAVDTSLSKALWDSGGDWKGRGFEIFGMELPTDSELLLTALGALFDEKLPPTTAARAAFTSRYIALASSENLDGIEPWRIRAGAVIYRSKARPPHFNVIAPGGKVIHLAPGRNNVFHAILVLVEILRDVYDGYAGQVYLGDPSIGLLDVIDAQ